MYKSLFFICLWFVLPALAAQAQEVGERGEVQDAEFIIRKDRVLTLPKMPRVFERTPVLPGSQIQGNYTYEVKDFFLDLQPVVTDTQPSLKNFPSQRGLLYHNYVKLGYGNYQSPLGELYINNVESDYLNFGVFLRHQGFYEGPVDGKNSAEDHTNIRLDGSIFQQDIEFFGKLGYDRDRHHFYGYTPIPGIEVQSDNISQTLSTVYGNIGLRRIERQEPFDYQASLSLRLFNDEYLAREHEVGLKAGAAYRTTDGKIRAGIAAEAFISSPSDSTYADINRQYAKFNPYVEYANESFKIRAGANLVFEDDEVPNKSSDVHILPNLMASYHLSPSFGIYAGLEGDVIRTSYYGFVMENPFLGPSTQLRNTMQNYQINAGVKGTVNDELNYRTGIKFGDFTNMHFYANHLNDSSRFQLVYDDATKVLNYYASVGWEYSNWYKLQATVDYYIYDLSNLNSPWHRPEWEVKLTNRFNPGDKWLISANAHLMGGIQALNRQSNQTTTLNPVVDLSARIDYSVSERFSIFAVGNNLLNQKNERYWNYKVRGIQGIGGISFKF